MSGKPKWRVLLDEALARHGDNKQAVANELGVSRTAVSLVCADKYHGRMDKFEKLVMDTYSRVECPHDGERVSPAQCKDLAERAAPTSSPREMRLWRACQNCQHKPTGVVS